MVRVKAVIFDFIGTLADLVGYSIENSKIEMYRSLVADGYGVGQEPFFEAYDKAHKRCREVRYNKLVEITNGVWISEALNELGYKTKPEDESIKAAVNVFFEDYLKALKLRTSAKTTLRKLSQDYKLGIISNYTYAPLIYAGLRKLNINQFFNAVLVSHQVGCRKPSPKIFKEALIRLRVKAEETVYVGDTPLEDIEGAKNAGIETVFIPSQFNSLSDMQSAPLQPDYVIEKLSDIFIILETQQS